MQCDSRNIIRCQEMETEQTLKRVVFSRLHPLIFTWVQCCCCCEKESEKQSGVQDQVHGKCATLKSDRTHVTAKSMAKARGTIELKILLRSQCGTYKPRDGSVCSVAEECSLCRNQAQTNRILAHDEHQKGEDHLDNQEDDVRNASGEFGASCGTSRYMERMAKETG